MTTIKSLMQDVLAEEHNMAKRLDQLVRAGLMAPQALPILHRGLSKLNAGMAITGQDRDAVTNLLNSLLFIVLGDDTMFQKSQTTVRQNKQEHGHNLATHMAMEAKKDPGEYDYEGDMAMSQLKSIMMNAKRLHDSLEPDTNLPEWVQSKITLAEDYITTATNYIEGTLEEAVEAVDEAMTRKQKNDAVRRFMSHDPKAGESILATGKKDREDKKAFASGKSEIKRLKKMGEEVEAVDEAVDSKKTADFEKHVKLMSAKVKKLKDRGTDVDKHFADVSIRSAKSKKYQEEVETVDETHKSPSARGLGPKIYVVKHDEHPDHSHLGGKNQIYRVTKSAKSANITHKYLKKLGFNNVRIELNGKVMEEVDETFDSTRKMVHGEPPKGTFAYERKYGKYTAKGYPRKRPNPNKPPKAENVKEESNNDINEVDMGQAERGMRNNKLKHVSGYHVVDGNGKFVSQHRHQDDAIRKAFERDDYNVKAVHEGTAVLDEISKNTKDSYASKRGAQLAATWLANNGFSRTKFSAKRLSKKKATNAVAGVKRAASIEDIRNNLSTSMYEEEQIDEGRPSQQHPLEGHEYHWKSDAQLKFIAKDAHAAAEAMKDHNTTAENKYRDQASDSATVRHFRKTSGMPTWYKKKYGHIKESDMSEDEQIDEVSTGLATSYFDKARKQSKKPGAKNRDAGMSLAYRKVQGRHAIPTTDDEKASDKEVKMATGIPHDKRYVGGNMTGAISAIEKIRKNLSKHPRVTASLKAANEATKLYKDLAYPSDGGVEIVESHRSAESHELVSHADNTERLYKTSHVPVAKNLEKKFKKGTYDHEKAKKLWKYHADRSADSYAKEHGSSGQKGHHIFSVKDRHDAASHFADRHHDEMKAGNFHEGVEYADIEALQEDYAEKFQTALKASGKTLAQMSDDEKKAFFKHVDSIHTTNSGE